MFYLFRSIFNCYKFGWLIENYKLISFGKKDQPLFMFMINILPINKYIGK